MKTILMAGLLAMVSTCLFAQQTPADSVRQTIKTMFDAMRKGDTTMLKSTFAKNMILQSISNDQDGKAILSTENGNDFAKVIGAPHAMVYDERVLFDAVKTDGSLASVWAPYKFYLGDKFHHCGVDVFQLMRTPEGWKIIYIVDTRRKDNCAD